MQMAKAKSGSPSEVRRANTRKRATIVELPVKAETGATIASHMQEVIQALGEDVTRDGLARTPARVEKALRFLTAGYSADIGEIVNGALFDVKYDEVVIVRDIEFFSMCEHHMLPFFGKAHVAYIPNGFITGLSKIARVVDVYSRRLQVQERLTTQILDAIKTSLQPFGVAVVIEASHLCMMMRGVQKQNSVTTTSAFYGQFEKNETRSEFLKLISASLH